MFQWIKGLFGRRSPGITNTVGATEWVDQWGKQRLPTRLLQLHEYAEVAYSCANLNSDAQCKTPLRAYAKLRRDQRNLYDGQPVSRATRKRLYGKVGYRASGRVEELTEHPFLTLLHDPNPYWTGYELLNFTTLYLETVGVCYWYVRYDLLGRPAGLWLMPPQYVTVLRDTETGYPRAYSYGGNTYDTHEVIEFKLPDLMNPFLDGRSPIRACWEPLNINDKFSATLEATLDNQARPDLVISFPEGGPDEVGLARLETSFNQKLRKAGTGGVLFIDEATEVTPLVFPAKDLAALQIFQVSKVTICNCFGVPPGLLEPREVSRANMVAAKALHAEQAVMPRLKRLEQRLNKFIREHYEPSGNLFVAFDDPTPELAELKQTELCGYVAGRIITTNEAREELGYAPIEGGDQLVGNFNFAADPDSGAAPAASEPTPEPEDEPKKPEDDKPKDDEKPKKPDPAQDDEEEEAEPKKALPGVKGRAKQLHRPGAIVTKPSNGGRLASALQKYFRWQKHRVLAELHRAKAAHKDIPDSFTNVASFDREMYTQCQPFIQIEFDEGGHNLIQQVGADPDVFNVQHPELKEAVKKLTLKFCEDTNATTTMALNAALDKLRDDLDTGLTGGERMTQLTDKVEGVFDQAEQYRAHRIAQSESSRSHHEGAIAAARASKVVSRMKLMLSSEACQLCVDVAEQTDEGIDLDGSFAMIGGNDYDGGESCLPIHPNCECTLEFVLDDETGDDNEQDETTQPDEPEADEPDNGSTEDQDEPEEDEG